MPRTAEQITAEIKTLNVARAAAGYPEGAERARYCAAVRALQREWRSAAGHPAKEIDMAKTLYRVTLFIGASVAGVWFVRAVSPEAAEGSALYAMPPRTKYSRVLVEGA